MSEYYPSKALLFIRRLSSNADDYFQWDLVIEADFAEGEKAKLLGLIPGRTRTGRASSALGNLLWHLISALGTATIYFDVMDPMGFEFEELQKIEGLLNAYGLRFVIQHEKTSLRRFCCKLSHNSSLSQYYKSGAESWGFIPLLTSRRMFLRRSCLVLSHKRLR